MGGPIHPYLSELYKKVPSGQKLSLRQERQRNCYIRELRPISVVARETGIWGKGKHFLDEFLGCSSIHGLGHLAKKEKHWSEYLLWILILLAAITGTSYMGLKAWRRYQHFPTVISMEKDYKNWNTTQATATICPNNKTDEAKLRAMATTYNVKNLEGFVEYFKKLASVTYVDFDTLPEYGEVSPNDYLQILAEAKFNFRFSLSNTENVELTPLLIATEIGLCYGFNTDLGIYFTVENINRKLPIKRGSGNLVSGNPLDGEVVIQAMNLNSGYNLSMTGPFDLPDMSVRRMESEMNHFLTLDLNVLPIISSEGLRSLSPAQRKCRFFDESYLDISDVYSYNLCRMQCRVDLAYQLCKCIPYFYRKSRWRPYCDARGLKCLGRHGRFLSDLRDPDTNQKIRCSCLPLCNDFHYLVGLENLIPWPGKTHLKYGMYNFPRTRLKREVIFGFADFLVSIGGSAGLLLGCSVLSFIEIVYFFTFRLFIFLRGAIENRA